MPCINRRGCTARFRDRLDASQLRAVLVNHGTCHACKKDVTDNPRFDDALVPYCPACFEERWPTGAAGPFERGQPQVYPYMTQERDR